MEFPDATPLEESRTLLHAASEVEHAVLVEYLYTAWSLGSSPLATKVKDIAIQEMCHFLTVQNLLLFAGAQPSIQRQDQDPTPELIPFQFSLRPFSRSVLEDYILAEMPPLSDMSAAQRAIVAPLVANRA